MDMSAAALPPVNGHVLPGDTLHPRYPEYRAYRSNMAILMVDASGFRDWLYQAERNERNDQLTKHPQYGAFVRWMRENKGGRRECPKGCFPENFFYWLEGGRW